MPEEDLAQRIEVARNIQLFKGFNDGQLSRVAGMLSTRIFEPGDPIVQQRETGEAMYIIQAGQAGIAVAGVVTEELGPGACFGDLSLVMDSPTDRTVVAVEQVRCFVLKAVNTRMMLEKTWGGRRELLKRKALLSKVSIFSSLNAPQIMNLCTSLERISFNSGEKVIAEGDAGDCMYVVEDG
jgi:CRP-like cAMP-binding protein